MPTKRIVCLCNLPFSYQDRLSAELMNAYDDLRKFNNENDVTGIFIVYKSTVLLVLEGEADAVASASHRAQNEGSFLSCSVIVDCDINQPYFSHWAIRLIKPNSENQKIFLARLRKAIEKDFKFETPKDRKLYEDIYLAGRVFPLNKSTSNPVTSQSQQVDEAAALFKINNFSTYLLSIHAWPKPTDMRLTTRAMKTCSMMTNRFVSYAAIIEKEIWATEMELTQFLNQLNHLSLLRLKSCPPDKAKTSPKTAQTQSDRFSQLLKGFISSPRQKAN